MFRNYWMAALRNLARNRLYAGINVGGLAVGFAAAILIGLFVRDEFSYESFIPDHLHAYRVATFRIVPGRSPIFVPVAAPDVAALMKLDFPEVRSVARLASEQVGPKDPKVPLRLPVVINETARRQLGYASPGSAIGQSVPLVLLRSIDDYITDEYPAQIIGVVTDFPMGSIRETIGPTVFYVEPDLFQLMSVKLSGRQIPETLASIDLLWKQLGNTRPVSRFFFDQQVENTYRDMIRQERLMTVLETVALLIACLGLFGIAAFSSERRTKEIGIRKVMGAETRDIMRMLLWQFSRPVLYGSLIAWPVAAYIMNRWLQSFAYHVQLGPWLFIATTALTLIIALLTVSAHCWPVARAKPAAALRYE